MNFPPFWAKAGHGEFSCWRWSHRSLAEAQSLAADAARQLAARFAGSRHELSRYAYADRPLREPVLREFKDGNGEASAVITRNSYGCLVLNTARVMFVDVDLPEAQRVPGGFLKKLFGKAEPAGPGADEQRVLAQAEAWAQAHAGWGWRVYRTRAGLRLLATHTLFAPDSTETEPVFDALGADPLYRRLCKTQKCFRARLTPKPWRCGIQDRPARWPFADAKAEGSFTEWEKRYLARCGDWATCELVRTVGNATISAEVRTVVSVHDEATRATSKLALA
jgi:hypothetical protein